MKLFEITSSSGNKYIIEHENIQSLILFLTDVVSCPKEITSPLKQDHAKDANDIVNIRELDSILLNPEEFKEKDDITPINDILMWVKNSNNSTYSLSFRFDTPEEAYCDLVECSYLKHKDEGTIIYSSSVKMAGSTFDDSAKNYLAKITVAELIKLGIESQKK